MARPVADIGPRLARLLEALDAAPQTLEDLAARLGLDEATVQELLADGAEQSLVVWWDPEYATTWRAKRLLDPAFFRRAVRGSLAVGLAVTGAALFVATAPGAATHGAAGACLVAAGALAATATKA